MDKIIFVPIIFGKNVTIHEEGWLFLEQFKEVNKYQLLAYAGFIIAKHYDECKSEYIKRMTDIPENTPPVDN